MKSHDEMDPVELGRYYGYPDCCILNFCGRMVMFQLGYVKLAAAPEHFPLEGKGFVPCPECRKRTEEDLLAEIASRRQCPKPFPEDEMSGEWCCVAVVEKE